MRSNYEIAFLRHNLSTNQPFLSPVVCDRNRESLAMVLSKMCAFGDPEAKAIVNETVEEVAVKRGVKRSVEEQLAMIQ